ncbi:MAG TPA: hypothetical protein VMZ90_14130 [Vicinamibacterales bacterium]|nr:hypothetical protein [Vicinamibacterales bacterium]
MPASRATRWKTGCGPEDGLLARRLATRALRALLVLVAAMLLASPAAGLQTRTRASLWYRGTPAGEPRQTDLDAIGAAGFSAVTWPTLFVTRALDLRRMAERAGLEVVIRTEPVPLRPELVPTGESYVDIDVTRTPVRLFPSLLWRSVAHGAQIISFDAGLKEGSGLVDAAGKPAPWAGAASAVAHQLAVNAVMVDTFKRAPAAKVDPAVPGLDVVLMDAGRSWVLIATNTAAPGTPPADTHVFLPRGVPTAEWLNLFDGSTISMLRQDTGPRWHIVLGPGDVRVYAIGKIEG